MENRLYGVRFVIDEEPCCVWDWDPKRHNGMFIEHFQPSYFQYIAQAYAASATDKNEHLFAIATRSAYSQALETLFALVGASLQAPDYVLGWLLRYQPKQLGNLIEKIGAGESIKTLLDLEIVSWESIVNALHPFTTGDSDKDGKLKESVAQSWAFFAADFLSEPARDEYNSIKHGLRIQSGGIEIGVALGHNAPIDEATFLGSDKFGSSYFTTERIPETKHHFQIQHHHRNWHPQDMLHGLSLISISIDNILQFLKRHNGLEAGRQQWPPDLNTFGNPWEFAHTLDAFTLTYAAFRLGKDNIVDYSKDDILSLYETQRSR